MVSKAVGIIMDRHATMEAEQEAAQAAALAVPVTGIVMPEYAMGTLQDLQAAVTPAESTEVMRKFATEIQAICKNRPQDEKALYYLSKLQQLEKSVSAELAKELGGEMVLAERIKMFNKGVQVGDKGVEQGMWPGITEMLSALPAKVTVFDMLK